MTTTTETLNCPLREDRPHDDRCDAACCRSLHAIYYRAGATEYNPDKRVQLCDQHYGKWLSDLGRYRTAEWIKAHPNARPEALVQ